MDYTFLLGSIENILGKSYKRARDNYAFHCPFCNHRKPKLEINFHTNEKGQNPWECWVCQTRGRTIRSLLRQLKTPRDTQREILKYLPKGTEIETDGDPVVVENKKEDANAGFYNAMADRIRSKFNN